MCRPKVGTAIRTGSTMTGYFSAGRPTKLVRYEGGKRMPRRQIERLPTVTWSPYAAARSEVVESSTPTRISSGPSVPNSNCPGSSCATAAVHGLSRSGRASAYNRRKGDCMDDVAGQFLDAIHRLEDVRDAITAERANAEFDETTLQLFWKKWPDLSAWAGSLWRMLSEELAGPSSPHLDGELDEVGGSD